MSESAKKRTLDAFFKPPPKKARVSDNNGSEQGDNFAIDKDHVSGNTSSPIIHILIIL